MLAIGHFVVNAGARKPLFCLLRLRRAHLCSAGVNQPWLVHGVHIEI